MAKYHAIIRLTVEMRTLPEGDEELGAVGIGPFVRHAKKGRRIQRSLQILVRKCSPVDGFTTSTVAFSEV